MQRTKDTAIGRKSLNMYSKPFEQRVVDFALQVVRGVIKNIDTIDLHIREKAENWDFARISVIDKQIMRVAIFEVFYKPETPAPVSINEAVDIAKLYSTSEAGHFVNGILDTICKKRTRSR